MNEIKKTAFPLFDGRMPLSRMIDLSLSVCFRYWRIFILPAILYSFVVSGIDYLTSPSVTEQLDFLKRILNDSEGGLDGEALKEIMFSSLPGDVMTTSASWILSVFMLGFLAAYFTHAVRLLAVKDNTEIMEIFSSMKPNIKSMIGSISSWLLFFVLPAFVVFALSLLPLLFFSEMSFSLFFTFFVSFVSVFSALCLIVVFFARLLFFPMIASEGKSSGIQTLKQSWTITDSRPNQPLMQRPLTRLTILLTVVTLLAGFLESFGSAPTDVSYLGLISQISGNLFQGGTMDVASILEQLVPPSATAMAFAFALKVLLGAASAAFMIMSLVLFYSDLKARSEM